MHSHPLARLTPISRARLIRRHLDDRVPFKALTAQSCVSLRSAYKLLPGTEQATWQRWRGSDGLYDLQLHRSARAPPEEC